MAASSREQEADYFRLLLAPFVPSKFFFDGSVPVLAEWAQTIQSGILEGSIMYSLHLRLL